MFQADFFVTYILTDGLSGFSLEILQPGLLCWDAIRSCTYGRGKEKTPYLYSLPYFRIIPLVSLSVLIGTVYAVVAPLLLPFLIGYFLLGYAVFINQVNFPNFAYIIEVFVIVPMNTSVHVNSLLLNSFGSFFRSAFSYLLPLNICNLNRITEKQRDQDFHLLFKKWLRIYLIYFYVIGSQIYVKATFIHCSI